MSEVKLATVLDASYQCLLRHGVRKTTMEDIARAAGMSRPAVYQYVRGKDDAFRRLAARRYDAALISAEAEAAGDGTLTQRLDRVLAVKLDLAFGLSAESPHASDLLTVAPDLDAAFLSRMTDLVTATVMEAAEDAGLALTAENCREFAVLALALTRGTELDSDPQRARERLRGGTALLVAGLAASVRPADPTVVNATAAHAAVADAAVADAAVADAAVADGAVAHRAAADAASADRVRPRVDARF